MPFENTRSVSFLILWCLYSCLALPVYSQQGIGDLQICPLTYTTSLENKSQNDCLIRYSIVPAGTTAYLTEQQIRTRDGVTECLCNYAIKKDDIQWYNCDDEPIEFDLGDKFAGYFLYHWLDISIQYDPEVCDFFNDEYPPGTYPAGFADTRFVQSASERALAVDVSNIPVFGTPEAFFAAASSGYNLLTQRSRTRDGCELPAEEIFAVALDANPAHIGAIPPGNRPDDIADWPVDDLLKVAQKREGITLDGTSKCLMRFKTLNSWDFDVTLDPDAGTIEFPWGTETHEYSTGHYGFFLYTPPENPPANSRKELVDGLITYQTDYKIVLNGSEEQSEHDQTMALYAPPVVLVHGTFDNPTNCWETPIPGGVSMVERLQDEGYMVFTCDYSSTNGGTDGADCEASFLFGGNAPQEVVNTRASSFWCNRKVVYENPGGVKEAVDFFRNELNVACTQADAIGHSMGGVLIRVYASDRETVASYDTDYYRDDNFQKGDVNRIITLGSTHHGSDAAWLADEVAKGITNEAKTIAEILLPQVIELAYYAAMYKRTGALIDQVPQSPALRLIGPTDVPSHAMAFYINSVDDLLNDPADMESALYYKATFAIGMLLYFYESITDNLLANIALKWDRLPAHLKEPKDRYFKSYSRAFLEEMVNDIDKFKDLYKAPLELNYDVFYSLPKEFLNSTIPLFEEERATILQYETAESSINDFDNDEHTVILNEQFNLIKDEYFGEFSGRAFDLLGELMNKYRFFIFKNDWNDGTVRYDSQTGSLDEQKYVSRFTKHIHSYEPRYPDVQNRVVELLGSGMSNFAPEGFPNAGRRLPIWLPDMSDDADDDITGCAAACWSGMVPDHAMAWARVADERNVIILNRPVNPDATPLIFNNASTKGMNLKGKSSNWGPQKGLIPVNQRFSKLWQLYEEPELTKQVNKFNKKVKDLIEQKPDEVEKRQMEKEYSCEFIRDETKFLGWITEEGGHAEDEIRFTSVGDPSTVYTWFDSPDPDGCPLVPCEQNCDPGQLQPFYVLANPDPEIKALNGGVAPVYTADYDLLAIGFFEAAQFENPDYPYPRPDYEPPERYFNCDRGIMFPEQIALLNELNNSVKMLGYTGGNVAHHGPENQFTNMSFSAFPCSEDMGPLEITANPYFDYPITAFEPDDIKGESAGIVRAISMGPPGYKDINLKRYIAQMRRKGFDIIANPDSPSWQWEYFREYSYELGFDDRDYPGMPAYPEELPIPNLQACIDRYGCLGEGPEAQVFQPIPKKPKLRFKAIDKFKLYPNPAGDEPVSLTIRAIATGSAVFRVTDALGREVQSGQIDLDQGLNQYWIDTQEFTNGQYFVLVAANDRIYQSTLIIQK